jgi:hypothetical protein
MNKIPLRRLAYILGLLSSLIFTISANAELFCAPDNVNIKYETQSDKYFAPEMKTWNNVTKNRYLEGGGPQSCVRHDVPGYEGFPVHACEYKSADAGKGSFDPILAKVLVLDPSAMQLASWSIHACRINGAADANMPKCLEHVRSSVITANGAQFPVAGSVVESICNSSPTASPCERWPSGHANRAPRNTLFRDGVTIYVEKISKWEVNRSIAADIYAQLFDVENSDRQTTNWGGPSRVSGGLRKDWKAWRTHIGKPVALNGGTSAFDLNGAGWQLISREVHKAACKNESNELFDAVVFSKKWAKQP